MKADNGKSKDVKEGRIRRERCAEILQAAEHEFAINGFKGTSTRAIADRAGLAKAQVHYYYASKEELYCELLDNILDEWNRTLAPINDADQPATVLRNYITAKLRLSIERPEASKIFAGEILRGAPVVGAHLRGRQRQWLSDYCAVIQGWIDRGLMDPLDPLQLIFMIWAVTQHYADFDVQVLALMDKEAFEESDLTRITEQICTIILKGCGLGE